MFDIQDKEEVDKLIIQYEKHARLAIMFFIFAGIFALLGILHAQWNFIVSGVWSILYFIKHIKTERIAKKINEIIKRGK